MSVLVAPFPRRTFVNSAAIFTGEGFARLSTFVMAVAIARLFGPVALGQYGYALALASILLLVPDLGLHLLAVRELAAEPAKLRAIFWSLHWLKLLLCGAVVAFTLLFGECVLKDRGRRLLLFVLVARVLLQTFSQAYMSIFKAFERMHYIAWQQFLNAALVIAWVGWALAMRAGLSVVVSGLLIGQVAETWLGWRIVKRAFSPGDVYKWDGDYLGGLFLACAPIGLTAVLQSVNLRLDILILSLYVPNRELGNFQAAAWFPVGTFLFASLLMAILFPKLSRLLRNPSAQGNAYVATLLKNGFLLMTLGSVGVWLGAPYLLRWCFGSGLSAAAGPLRILAATLPFVFINTAMFYVFVAAERRVEYVAALVLSVILGGALSLYLAGHFGATGSAFADLIREFVVTVVYLSFLVRAGLARSAGLAFLGVLAGATGLVALVVIPGASGGLRSGWPAAWNLLVLAGTLIVLGFPRWREFLLLADDKL